MPGYLPLLRKNFYGKDIISASQFTREFVDHVHEQAEAMEQLPVEERTRLLRGKKFENLFYDKSTRTVTSFQLAQQGLGAAESTFAPGASSEGKGEPFHDTIRQFDSYVDCIVIRHPEMGKAREAAEYADITVINAGDGKNQHPTQALLSSYAIRMTQNGIDGCNIGIVGDLENGRVAHSLLQLLNLYDCHVYLVSPDNLRMPEHVLEQVNGNYTELRDLREILSELDVVEMLRVQDERFNDKDSASAAEGSYGITTDMLTNIRSNLKIQHPLPKRAEIGPGVDKTKFAYWEKESAGGIPVRQALIRGLVDDKFAEEVNEEETVADK